MRRWAWRDATERHVSQLRDAGAEANGPPPTFRPRRPERDCGRLRLPESVAEQHPNSFNGGTRVCEIKASGKFKGQALKDIPVLNPGDWFGKTWLIEIEDGFCPVPRRGGRQPKRRPRRFGQQREVRAPDYRCRLRISPITRRWTPLRSVWSSARLGSRSGSRPGRQQVPVPLPVPRRRFARSRSDTRRLRPLAGTLRRPDTLSCCTADNLHTRSCPMSLS